MSDANFSSPGYNIHVSPSSVKKIHRIPEDANERSISCQDGQSGLPSLSNASEQKTLVVSEIRQEETKKDGFADIFGGLENMSNTSTLFDGMSEEGTPHRSGFINKQKETVESVSQTSKGDDTRKASTKVIKQVNTSDEFVINSKSLKLP